MPFIPKKRSGVFRTGKMGSKYGRTLAKRKRPYSAVGSRGGVVKRLRRIERTIETKEQTSTTGSNVQLPHNNIVFLSDPFNGLAQGAGDPMTGGGNRIGDKITIKGITFVGMLQNVAHRPKVYYRLMLVKYAKGDTPTRATLFKGCTNNKMIDQVNTERFTIVSQRVLNVTCTGAEAFTSVTLTGEPNTDNGGTLVGAVGTKIVKMWIPGAKICRGGYMQFENGTGQPKFFDYRWVIMAYDWHGTPQDLNIVGSITDCYTKMYFKDA